MALVYSVVAVMVVSLLAAAFMQLALSVTRRLNSTSDTVQAFNIAEAGLAEAYMGLGVARSGNVGTIDEPAVFGGGLVWVEAIDHPNSLVELQSTAMYGTGRATLGIVCQPVANSVSSLGFFTDEDLRLNPEVRLDSYDSSQGSYASQVNTALNQKGKVGSNGNIAIAGDDLILGDVVYGPTGGVTVANGAVVTGTKSSRSEIEVLPPVEVPSSIPATRSLNYSGARPLVVPPGDAGFKLLDMAKNTQLVVKGPLTLVVGSLYLRSGAQMVFDTTDGPVEMYVQENLDLQMGSVVTTSTTRTSDVTILVAAEKGKAVNFGAKAQFYGFVYAPLADTHFSSTYELFGGLVCEELHLSSQGKLHLDTSLAAGLVATLPTMQSWRVVELPQQVAANRMDPFQVLGLDPSVLPSLADAREDQVLQVTYVASDGSTDSYVGRESDFDWELVKQLLFGARDGLTFFLSEGYLPAGQGGGDPLVDLVNSNMTSRELRDALLAAAPVSEASLIAACERDPPMTSADLDRVLDANKPLSEDVMIAAINSPALDANTLKGDLIDNSPLSSAEMSALLARNPPLSAKDMKAVLAKQ